MKPELQITYRHCDSSHALNEVIQSRFEELTKFYDRIGSCRVVVERPSPHHRHGEAAHFHVRIEMTVPGEEIVVSRTPAATESYEDAFFATGEAFHAARRQLQDFARRQRGDVKTHVTGTHDASKS